MALDDLKPDQYLVFEADQVLTNKHLNQLFYYLDQQNRWTRNKLIGIGIACGLEIVLKPGIIEITKGCGVTSQGYLILHGPMQYTYYLPYSPVERPEHLPFDYTDPPGLPFYKEYCDKAGPVFQLLDDDGYDKLEQPKKLQAKTLSSATAGKLLGEYVVVLFLEADEMDLKNCDAFDCNNEGERMMLQVRPLLVRKKDLPDAIKKKKEASATATKATAPELALRRFNVPYSTLRSTDDIIAAFTKITDDATLNSIAAAYNFCYDKYKGVVKVSVNPFTNLADALMKQRKAILANQPWLIQYFYDFIDDLVKAYLELRAKMNTLQSACCPDENKFPLHLVLGEATTATSNLDADAYRARFIYSPLFARQEAEIGETILLFGRMVILTQVFTIEEQQALQATAISKLKANRRNEDESIKITPSRYELAWLSQRAIPYYYQVNAKGSELYKYWNFYKTMHGNATFNLGYHAPLYSHADVVLNPLLYDIEHNDFFRIEGHIGLPYEQVLKNLLRQRLSYNLPFDVVAIAANRLPRTNTDELPECNMQDLETDYKLIVSEFTCKVQDIFCGVAKREYAGNDGAFSAKTSSPVVKGDFLRKNCPPKAGTVGAAYLSIISKNGVFANPVQIVQQENQLATASLGVLYASFEFIDAVEALMVLLQNSTISNINMPLLMGQYKKYIQIVGGLYLYLTYELHLKLKDGSGTQAVFGEDVTTDILWDQQSSLSTTCLDERLQALKEEYNRRLQLYALQRSFYYYYQKHPGLEHKGGVPKGGTFVLVYHTRERQVQNLAAVNEVATIADRRLAATVAKTTTGTANDAQTGSTLETLSYYQYDDTEISVFKSFVDECNDAPPEKKKLILGILERAQPVVPPRYEIPDEVVIADFYVPYLCCSDCPPVAYILQKEKTPTEEPAKFDIASKEYVFDDAHNYPFTASPPVTNAGTGQDPFASTDVLNPNNLSLLTDESNTLYLHPAMPELEKTLKATVAYKNISLPITIIKPDATFTYSLVQGAATGSMLQLKATDTAADEYEWTVNGKENLIDNKAVPTPVSVDKLKKDLQAKSLQIALTVGYTRNEVTSTDTTTQAIGLEACVDFEPPLKEGTQYGSRVSQPPGTEMFTTSDKVTVRIQDFKSVTGGSSVGIATIIKSPVGFTGSQVLSVNNVCIEFDYTNVSFKPTQVKLDFMDQGGTENLLVNDSNLYIGELTAAPATLGGVNVTVTMNTGTTQKTGVVLLQGDIKKFRIGGQEFFIDNVCASR